MTTDQEYVLSRLRVVFGMESMAALSVDNQYVATNILRNGILLTVFKTLPDELQQELSGRYNAAIKQAIIQEHEGIRVLRALSGAGMDCIALKGWELRKLYPELTMRQMADLDILVRPYDFEKIKAVMDGLGYSSGRESRWKHDSFKKREVHVEMHKRLTDDSTAIRAWERGMWERAKPTDGGIYKMSPEDYYIFHFVHLHKDFMNGSLGLRRIADTWLLQKQPVDMETVKATLEAFGMWRFHERMVKLSRAAMGDEAMDGGSEVLLLHAFRYGIYGSNKSYKTGRIAAMSGGIKSGKLKSGVAAVFLPYKRMKAQFPVLEKWPILLPYCWLRRIVHFLKGNMKKNRRMLDYSDISEADYREMKRFFEAGGVLKNERSQGHGPDTRCANSV